MELSVARKDQFVVDLKHFETQLFVDKLAVALKSAQLARNVFLIWSDSSCRSEKLLYLLQNVQKMTNNRELEGFPKNFGRTSRELRERAQREAQTDQRSSKKTSKYDKIERKILIVQIVFNYRPAVRIRKFADLPIIQLGSGHRFCTVASRW